MNILLLEDSVLDADLTKRGLTGSIPDCHIDIAGNLAKAREFLYKGHTYDVALLDMKLPDGNGLDLLFEIRQSGIDLAVIVLTGSGNEEVAVAALKAGADDYVAKRPGYVSQLPQAIEYAIRGYKNNIKLKSDLIDVLYIEPNSTDIDLTIYHLNKYAPNIRVKAVLTVEEALRELTGDVTKPCPYQILLMDYHLTGLNALELIKIIRQDRKMNIPIILVTGLGNEEVAVQALKLGANDYLTKSEKYLFRLPSMITNAYQHYDRKRNQAALAESESKYRLLADNSADVIFILDLNLNFTYISPAIKNLRNFKPEEAMDQKLTEVLTPDSYPKAMNLIAEIISEFNENPEKQVAQKIIELEVYKKDHSTVWTEITTSLLMDEKNNPIGILGVTRDISVRKGVMQELIKSKERAEESDRLKTAFLNNISHEIRTPMNAIVGFCNYINSPALSAEKRKQFTDIIVQSSNQLLSVITDIISIASIEAGQEKIKENEIELHSVLAFLKHQFMPKAQRQNIDLNLQIQFSNSGERVLTDETKLVQILTNLIENAIKFTDQGHVDFGYTLKDNSIEFYVSDTGIGIPSEMHEEIFQRFRQVDTSPTRLYGGSGLGLSISKAYVELLGGKIWLKSELGKGSVFFFTIPFRKAGNNALLTEAANDNSPELFEQTLLIAEDEETNLMLLEELLSGLNFKIIKAVNGLEAVEICRSNLQIDLVLMDLKMPVLDGYEATRQIKKLHPDLPVLAQTAYSTDEDTNKALACGCNDFICKPLKKELLIEKIREQLALHQVKSR